METNNMKLVKKASNKMLKSSSSWSLGKKEKSEYDARHIKTNDSKLRKMNTQSSIQSLKFDFTDDVSPNHNMNPNEAEFHKQEVKNKLKRERSDIIKRLWNELDSNISYNTACRQSNIHQTINKSDTSFNNNQERACKSLSK